MSSLIFTGSYSPSLSEEDIQKFELVIGQQLPDEYRRFLLQHNGGHPEPSVFNIQGDMITGKGNNSVVNRLFGLHNGPHSSLMLNVRTFHERLPKDLIAIGDDPFGNLLCISLGAKDTGCIYFWDHEEEVDEGETPTMQNVYWVAPGFLAFLECLRPQQEIK